jgi:hypothetical protein
LGRTIRWSDEGISIEGNNKYVDLMATEWNLKGQSVLSTTGSAEDKRDPGGEEALGPHEATAFRRSAAMGIYMAQDRGDLSYASKEIARGMATPTQKDAIKLKKLIRYLLGAKRRATMFTWQDPPCTVDGFTDSDWAGCPKTRRSTSGGVLLHGNHLVHHWSSTQTVVALSSMEAELNAIVKGVAEVLGLKNLLAECGRPMEAVIYTDSSAANGVVHRQGSGKVKHLECRQLWVQDAVFSGRVRVEKVSRDFNPADAFTHFTSVHEASRHFKAIGLIDPTAQRGEDLHLCQVLLQAPIPDQPASLDAGSGQFPRVQHEASWTARAAIRWTATASWAASEGGCGLTPSQAPPLHLPKAQLQTSEPLPIRVWLKVCGGVKHFTC